MTELPRHEDDLAAVMAFVSDEVGQDMRDVEREVAPHVGLRRRYVASRRDAELEERFDPPATPLERGQQFTPRDRAAVHRSGDRDPVFPAEGLEPHAASIVKMPRDHADRAPWSPWNRSIPDRRGEMLDEIRRHPAVGPPGGEKR